MPRNAEQTQKRILDAAYVLFRRRGYSRVSMDEIAAATSVTKRTLYYHLPRSEYCSEFNLGIFPTINLPALPGPI